MPSESKLDQFLGVSAWAAEIRKRIPQIARHRYNVAVTGDEGTGKRLLARLVHDLSPRVERPMIPVDCGLLGPETFASQMFGHEAGAFDGVTGAALGCLRASDGGTVCLANVEALSLEHQHQLLTALSKRKVTPVGGETSVPFDVRVITSSLHDLQKQVQDRRLLPQLYTLLDAVSLRALPLTKRLEDVEPLARGFLVELAEELEEPPKILMPDGCRRLQQHSWPGNVAELREAIERAAVFAEGDQLSARSFAFLQ